MSFDLVVFAWSLALAAAVVAGLSMSALEWIARSVLHRLERARRASEVQGTAPSPERREARPVSRLPELTPRGRLGVEPW